MINVKDILAYLSSVPKKDQELIEKAYLFAKEAHKGHKRLSGEPYFNHLVKTAAGLAEIGMDAKTIAAGLLHDTIEDTEISADEIKKHFGEEVLFLVEGVTKLGTLKYRGLKRHTESLRKLFVATAQDIRVVLIKLYDRLNNMETNQFHNKERQKRKALETLEVYVPIAERLGMGLLKRNLEDLAFPYVYPKEYEEMKKITKQRGKQNEKRLEKISRSIKKELASAEITNFKTEIRIKGLYSLYKKLERKGGDIEKIHDISAIRIILKNVNDCYKALGVIHSIWKPLPGKIKDYISFPKPNGYQSLHTTIFTGDEGIVEIQIRTEEMHRAAQYGIASHLTYKESSNLSAREQRRQAYRNVQWIRDIIPSLFHPFNKDEKIKKKDKGKKKSKNVQTPKNTPQWIKAIVEAQQYVDESDEFLDNLKRDFFSYRVFVFTPKGDVIDLPLDSSPIDFAYAIHSDIGDHTSGAKVNGKLVSLNTKLNNGDIVEIITKDASHPTQKWLSFTQTNFARRHIRAILQKLDTKD